MFLHEMQRQTATANVRSKASKALSPSQRKMLGPARRGTCPIRKNARKNNVSMKESKEGNVMQAMVRRVHASNVK